MKKASECKPTSVACIAYDATAHGTEGARTSGPLVPLLHGSLFCAPKADAWAGAARAVKAPDLPNFLAVPLRATTTADALNAIAHTDQVKEF